MPEGNDRIIATVNGQPVYMADLNRTIALAYRRDSSFKITPDTLSVQMDILIDKRLLIQEAIDKKLDQTDIFANTIKTFWEQTLIRDLMTYKEKELDKSITVSEEEIKNLYDKISHNITVKILKSEDRTEIDRMLPKDSDSIAWDEEIGPIGLENADSPILIAAFDIPEGEKRAFRDGNTYYLVYLEKKEEIALPSYEDSKEKLKEEISSIKKKEAFNAWLSGLRKGADIEIDEDMLKGYGYAKEGSK